MKVYSLCGVTMGFACPNIDQSNQLDALWRTLFNIEEISVRSTPAAIQFQFKPAGTFLNRPSPAQVVSQSRQLSVWKTEAGYYLQCGTSILDLDVAHGRAVGVINRGFWSYPLEAQREFFMLSFLMLLRTSERYGLHANGIVKDGIRHQHVTISIKYSKRAVCFLIATKI